MGRAGMSKRQREVLRAVRSREQARAVERRRDAKTRVDAAFERLQSVDAQYQKAAMPPAVGAVTRMDREARRRQHLARLRVALVAAQADAQAARAALSEAETELQQRARDVQAVDVLDARAADAASRVASRRAEVEAEERNGRAQAAPSIAGARRQDG
ncbi:MAG: hypothetical protein ACI9U2_000586 [Bradymonadia bacterium]|jgi:hypothetical protein